MPERIVEIAEDQRHLSMFRGFMLVESTENHRTELGRIPLDDIGAVIANAHGLSYTNNLLVSLSESLVDWAMYSDRNYFQYPKIGGFSLVDWDMYSDRN